MGSRTLLAFGAAAALTIGLANFAAAAKPAAAKCSDPAGCVVLGSGEPVRIGTFVISDVAAPLGTESARATELAVELRDGTVAGHPIQLAHFGDGCEPGLATTTAEAIAADGSLVAVIGTTCSRAAFPVAPILSEAGITMISPSNTNALLTDPATRAPFYFRTAYNDGFKVEALAEFVSASGHETAATVVVDEVGGLGLSDRFAARFTQLGGTMTEQLTVTNDQSDFSAVLADIADGSPPDVLFFFVFANGAAFVTQARDTAELASTTLASVDDVVNQELLDELDKLGGLADAEGIVFSAPDFLFLEEEPYLTTLLHEYLLRFGDVSQPDKTKPIFPYHAYAFDATNRLLDVIQSFQKSGAQQLVIPRTALRDALAATSGYEGVIGSITCDPNGDCNPQDFVIRIVQGGEFADASP